MRARKRIVDALAILAIVIAIPNAAAQEDSECMLCHGEPDISATQADGTVVSLYVDSAAFIGSAHGENGCASCHYSIDELPHENELEPVNCGVCHAESEPYAESLHGKALILGNKDVAACQDCHGKHDIRTPADPLSRVHPKNLPATCGRCHANRELARRNLFSITDPIQSYLRSAHAQAIASGTNDSAAACNDCHGTHDLLPAHDSDSPVYAMNVPNTCGKCHNEIAQEFNNSVHGASLRAGVPDAPNCTDCHGEHEIIATEDADSPVASGQISTSTCVRCHEDEQIMTRYGVEIHRQASYMDSYHGVTSAASPAAAANCTSCHGTHGILRADDPMSTVHASNVVATCAQCHDNANQNFAASPVHFIPTQPGHKALDIVRIAYIALIMLAVGFMLLHNALLMGRKLFDKLRSNVRDTRNVKRFSWGLRLGHFILALSFLVLVVTGFALRYSESWWAKLLFHADPELQTRSDIHRFAAIGLVLIVLADLIFLACSRRGHRELKNLLPRWKDIKDLSATMAFTVGLRRKPPKIDRYGYKEKVEYWGLMWGSAIMILTGFCMWFADQFLHYFSKTLLDIAALVHFFEAWLALLSILLWHLYFVVIDPDAYPMNWSWLTGRISEKEMQKHHAIEYEKEFHTKDPTQKTMPQEPQSN